jgi:hypothetical protein
LGTRILDEPGSVQTDPKEFEKQLSEIWQSEPSEELSSDIDSVQRVESAHSDPQIVGNEIQPSSELRANSEPIILPPLSTGKNVSLGSGSIESFVQTFVSNFLEQSLAEYLDSLNLSSSPANPQNIPSDSSSNQQFIPLYIQDILHTVLQSYLTNHVPKTEPLCLENNHPSSPLPAHEITEIVSADKIDEASIHSQKLAEVTRNYEERISSYEERLKELESNYSKLQKSSQETISSQSLKLLTLGELLEEKNNELLILRSEKERQVRKDDENRQQAMETISLLTEELYGVRYTWKIREEVFEKEKDSLVDQLNDAQNELAETNYYYQVWTSLSFC